MKDCATEDIAAPLFAFVQVAALAVFELIQGTGIKVEHNLYVDRFSMILMIFISITGGLICCYGNRYMDRFHQKYPELKDRRNCVFCSDLFWHCSYDGACDLLIICCGSILCGRSS